MKILQALVANYPQAYAYIKALHIVAVVCWFAGLFYLPRLFVYHASTCNTTSQNQFKTMEHKLFWFIMTPAGIVAIILGEALVHLFYVNGIWLQIKVGVVATLIFYHLYCFKIMEDFAKDCNTRSHAWFRVFNEYPTLVLIVCVVLSVVKPGS